MSLLSLTNGDIYHFLPSCHYFDRNTIFYVWDFHIGKKQAAGPLSGPPPFYPFIKPYFTVTFTPFFTPLAATA